jgi:RNA polymerase sigma factor (sigma-70 family)
MVSGSWTEFLRRLRGATVARAVGDRTDAELLGQFVACQDEAAFEALVQRHGPMVLGVCQYLLADAHDVEDAFQATFLVLVSKAASIGRRALLANWLYGVAYRVAHRARVRAYRRRAREVSGGEEAAAQGPEGIEPDLRPVLHEELNRLPEKYRTPVVLCYMQGKTNEEAARQLAWPVGTVKGRLTRARELLRARLTRRGWGLPTATLAALLTRETAAAAVPGPLSDATAQAALLVAAGQTAPAGVVSAGVAALSRGVLQTMFLTKLTTVCGIVLGLGVLGTGTGLFAYQFRPDPAGLPPRVTQAGRGQEANTQDGNDQQAARKQSAANLSALLRAMHAYLDVNGHFPPAAVYDKNGKALLSWRVLLLPYLGEDNLFKQFRLNEPWDSEHNKTLLAKMPKQFAAPVRGKAKNTDATYYQVFVGKDTVFDGADGVPIQAITDGTSNTFALAEAAEPVPWTKPADLPFDAGKPLPKLGGLFAKGFHAATADGAVHWLRRDFDAPTMRQAITRSGGEVLNFDLLKADD